MIFTFTPQEHEEFHADIGYSSDDFSGEALTSNMAEERMNAILEAWGWTETPDEDEADAGTLALWQRDVDTAYQVAVNAPSQLSQDMFEQLMTAAGWPRTY